MRRALWAVTMLPAVENIRSLGTEVAGTHSKHLANFANCGYFTSFAFHHSNGFDSGEIQGSALYCTTSKSILSLRDLVGVTFVKKISYFFDRFFHFLGSRLRRCSFDGILPHRVWRIGRCGHTQQWGCIPLGRLGLTVVMICLSCKLENNKIIS